VLDELESQNEEQVGVLTGKVKMLKDVSENVILSVYAVGVVRARIGQWREREFADVDLDVVLTATCS
jgi:hypothetical protein